MELKIEISDRMSNKESLLGEIENKLIRLPEELKDKLNVNTGSFLCVKGSDGKNIYLKVSEMYESDDIYSNGDTAYVSSITYNKLSIKKTYETLPLNDILIGADPEFFLVNKDTNKIFSARNIFKDYGKVANDGGLMELRPDPSYDELTLTNNIKDLLTIAYKKVNERKLFADKTIELEAHSAYDGECAGFHIHFGFPPAMLINTDVTEILAHRIVSLLDYYIGILSIIPEGDSDSKRRSYESIKYGKPGDFRMENNITYEYRVPGGYLLRHPLLTCGIFGVSRVVIKDIMSRLKIATENYNELYELHNYNSLKKLYPNLPCRSTVYEALTDKSIKKAKKLFSYIKKDIKNMISYNENDKYVNKFIDYIDYIIDNDHSFSSDIAHNWRISDERQQRQVGVH